MPGLTLIPSSLGMPMCVSGALGSKRPSTPAAAAALSRFRRVAIRI